jgi:hypothetical protein
MGGVDFRFHGWGDEQAHAEEIKVAAFGQARPVLKCFRPPGTVGTQSHLSACREGLKLQTDEYPWRCHDLPFLLV